MEIRATDTEIDLSGTPAELRAITHSLEKLAGGEVREFSADTTADPAPYERVLCGLHVVASAGQVRIAVVGSWLVVEGEAHRLATFASWFAFPEDAKFPAHGHYEWYPGHPDIAEESRPLVVSVAKQAE